MTVPLPTPRGMCNHNDCAEGGTVVRKRHLDEAAIRPVLVGGFSMLLLIAPQAERMACVLYQVGGVHMLVSGHPPCCKYSRLVRPL